MKKLILLLLFIPLVSFGQTDFRKMSWGDSLEDLKKTYPEATFKEGSQQGFDMIMQEGTLIGKNVFIIYVFSENELVAGMYNIDPTAYKDSKERLRDFNTISARLNEKYTMEREDEWLTTTWKDDPNDLSFAVALGDAVLVETAVAGDTRIVHNLAKQEHNIVYGSTKWTELMRQVQQDDF